MITVCPKCQLPLNVTPADLRVAMGQVRCGRCAQVFNALVSLQEEAGAVQERHATTGVNEVIVVTGGADVSANTGSFQPAAPAPQPAGADIAATDTAATSLADRASRAIAAALAQPPARESASGSEAAQEQEPEGEPRDFGADTLTSADIAALMAASAEQEREALEDGAMPAPDESVMVVPAARRAVEAQIPAPPATIDAEPEEQESDAGEPPGQPLPEVELPAEAAFADEPARADAPVADEAPSGAAVDDSKFTVTGNLPVQDIAPPAAVPFELTPAANDAGIGLPPVANDPFVDDETEWRVVPQLGGAGDRGAPPADHEETETQAERSDLRWLDIEAAPAGAADPLARARAAAAAVGAGGSAPDGGRQWRVESAGEATPAAAAEEAETDRDDLIESLAPRAAAAVSRGAQRAWLAGTALLGLLLAMQLVHHHRRDLIGIQALRGPLGSIYAALGQTLTPEWDLAAYDVRQLGVVADDGASGTLRVHASIRNQGREAQPAPLLRVVLQDRYGRRIAMRDLAPHEYSGAAAGSAGGAGAAARAAAKPAAAPVLEPGRRIEADVALLDPEGKAVGFELDACLRRDDGAIACANEGPATLR